MKKRILKITFIVLGLLLVFTGLALTLGPSDITLFGIGMILDVAGALLLFLLPQINKNI